MILEDLAAGTTRLLAEVLGIDDIKRQLGFKNVSDTVDDVGRDVKDLRQALKTLVDMLQYTNDEDKDVQRREERLAKQRERLRLKQYKTIRDLYTMARGRERMHK